MTHLYSNVARERAIKRFELQHRLFTDVLAMEVFGPKAELLWVQRKEKRRFSINRR